MPRRMRLAMTTDAAAIQAAQAGIVDNVSVFQGPNFDTLDNSYRQADGTHFNNLTSPFSTSQLSIYMSFNTAFNTTGIIAY